ncbi:unnamed protein product [Linum tenue]|uniref:Uncharacterized protein n=1 Tax=Linum tenue TaxID=586396 RepID=A0AAV0LTT7_9ROSI|nr:unnamed protein product [Linum tenue]
MKGTAHLIRFGIGKYWGFCFQLLFFFFLGSAFGCFFGCKFRLLRALAQGLWKLSLSVACEVGQELFCLFVCLAFLARLGAKNVWC